MTWEFHRRVAMVGRNLPLQSIYLGAGLAEHAAMSPLTSDTPP